MRNLVSEIKQSWSNIIKLAGERDSQFLPEFFHTLYPAGKRSSLFAIPQPFENGGGITSS